MNCHALSDKNPAKLAAAIEKFSAEHPDVGAVAYAIDPKGTHHALVFYGAGAITARGAVAGKAERFISEALS